MNIGFSHPWLLLLLIPLITGTLWLVWQNRGKQFPVQGYSISAGLAFICLSIAIAGPFLQTESNAIQQQRVDVFTDKSTSMRIFDKPALPETGLDVKTIARNDSSPVFSNIIANLQKESHAVLDTDGWHTSGQTPEELQSIAREYNTTVYLLERNQTEKEASVTVQGPAKVFPGKETAFQIQVHGSVPDSAQLIVKVNNTTVYTGQAVDTTIRQAFQSGHPTITAQLQYKDRYAHNNRFYKTIQVIDKPQILYVGDRSAPLVQLLHQFYTVTTHPPSEPLPDLTPYYNVVLNNVDASPENVEAVRSYVTDNNGLFVVGGDQAYDTDYKGAFAELLPVSLTGLKQDKEQSLIILAVDISGSTGKAFNTENGKSVVDMEKGLALSIIKSLDKQNRVGAIAFNDKSHLIATPQLLQGNRGQLTDKIARLQHQGGTKITQAIYGARQLIGDKQGDIILISDGKVQKAEDRQNAKAAADTIRQEDITLHTVSVGEGSAESFLYDLAQNGGGYFFSPQEHHKFSVIFSQQNKDNKNQRQSLVALNNDHFITENLEMTSTVGSYNDVKPKKLATQLVTTGTNRPALTVWRYGVGRVASLTAYDGGTLGNILEEDADFVLKTVNWLAGDPLRKQNAFVEVTDTRVNDTVTVTVKRDTFNDQRFSQIEENVYKHTFTANETGIQSFLEVPYAVNYKQEFQRFGYNPQLRDIVENTGGKVISAQELNNLQDLIESRKKTIPVTRSLRPWCIGGALGSVLIAIVFRKLLENRGDTNA